MKKYSIFHVPVMSFFSKSLYRDVARQWKGVGYGYLLLLLIVCWIAPTVKIHQGFSDFVDKEAPKIVTQIPKLTIVNGRASIDEPQPYRITDPQSGKILAVIDTTGAIRTLEEADAHILITEREAIFKKNEFQTDTFAFKDVNEFTLDQNMINGWLETAKGIVWPIVYVAAVLGAFVFRIIQSLIYACIGLVFASSCKPKLTYASLIRLSIVAVTPGIIVETVLFVAGVDFPHSGWCYFLAAMGFLFFGVKAASQDETPTNEPPPLYQPHVPDIPPVPPVPDSPNEA
ncbi:MAG: DUF1189 family protein [Phycisphaerae bacterium]|nr:DUF1189 family protein [Phycisphaerae bacterium]